MKRILQRMMVYMAITLLWLVSNASAEQQFFSTVDGTTGKVTTGTVQTNRDGSQSYMWNDGRGNTDTGYVSPPQGNTRNYSIYDGDTGKSSIGSIEGSAAFNRIFLPEPIDASEASDPR